MEVKPAAQRIGIMGGTFDPVHIGHLVLAQRASEQFELGRVLFMPSADPPHKRDVPVLASEHRRAMTRLAVEGNNLFEYSDLEFERAGYSYTSDTLQVLGERYPGAELYFIMGADSLFAIDTWHEPELIFRRAVILAANRLDLPVERLMARVEYLKRVFDGRIELIDMPDIAVSSSNIRAMVRGGRSIRYLVTDPVYDYIKENGLYTG